MLTAEIDQFHELSFYTLAHPDRDFFIHQLIVDAYTAQHADENTKHIAITFALAGLYLFAERNYTGKQVQLAHMEMAKHKMPWPAWDLPEHRGNITVNDVLDTSAGYERDEMIKAWALDVWSAYAHLRDDIAPIVP